jgi:methylenetetrahydrofolate dehydrogenase (NADP+) / methenyltetrahydrofolate cyclohydrolase
MFLLDGKIAASAIKQNLQEQVAVLKSNNQKVPHLAAVLVGEHPASQAYVGNKVRTCEELGYTSTLIKFESDVAEDHLLKTIQQLNANQEIDGILVQLPLPKHIDEKKLINAIIPTKDVDGFHPVNVGNMCIGDKGFLPATPYGIMLLLQHYKVETVGKHCVVLGRSNIVGTPMSVLMSRNTNPGNATVTLCHSRTIDLENILKSADIIIAAIGIPHFVTKEMIKPGAVIIDVGINSIDAPEKKTGKRLVGDVDFDNVKEIASAITPVPGGVGLMTIAGLMQNTYNACLQNNSINN